MIRNHFRRFFAPGKFEAYCIGVCLAIVLPFVIAAVLLRNAQPWLFHTLLFVAGWVLWSWVEYHVHRFLLHPATNKRNTGTAQSHQHHHQHPAQLEVTVFHRILLFVFNLLVFWIAWKLNNYFTFFAGFAWGSAAFCYIHYLLHHEWTKIFLRVHHRVHIHHHSQPDKYFGVTVPWWDHLFGTAPESRKQFSKKVLAFYYSKDPLP